MKALTLHQPWASALALGLKRFETRGWSTKYRGQIVIHAALNTGPDLRAFWAALPPADREAFAAAGYGFFKALPTMQPVAVAELVEIVPVESALAADPLTEHPLLTARELRWGDYSAGRYVWMFANLRRVAYPAHRAVAGAQGLWNWRGDPLPAPVSQERRAVGWSANITETEVGYAQEVPSPSPLAPRP